MTDATWTNSPELQQRFDAAVTRELIAYIVSDGKIELEEVREVMRLMEVPEHPDVVSIVKQKIEQFAATLQVGEVGLEKACEDGGPILAADILASMCDVTGGEEVSLSDVGAPSDVPDLVHGPHIHERDREH